MKLSLALLQRLIEVPAVGDAPERSELRHLLDDLGLEVKGIEGADTGSVVFNIETLANRGDHLSALGVAREIAARTLTQVRVPQMAGQLSDRKPSLPVRRITEKCSRYHALELSLPKHMERRADIAAVLGEDGGKHHPMVDLLNYVQKELGQPMHAFDHSKIEGEIIIDTAAAPEEVEALDGKRYVVPEGAILIRDRKKTIAVAGIIGCANSMVTEGTQRVVVEAATFDPVTVRKTARAMGISTDASYAFERGTDPDGIPAALRRVLFLATGSAGVGAGEETAHALGYGAFDGPPSEKRRVVIRLSRLRRELNLLRLDEVEVTARLKNLGYHVESTVVDKTDRELTVTVPSWRLYDVSNADDLVEDVARSISLSRVKEVVPPLDLFPPKASPLETAISVVRPVLIGNGFVEIISKGFYSAKEVELLSSLDESLAERHVRLSNALEANNSHMKVTNVVHMANVLAENLKIGVAAPKVFEVSRLFELADGSAKEGYQFERDVLTVAASGRWSDNEWRRVETLEQRAFAFKGVIEAILKAMRHSMTLVSTDAPLLHPGVSAAVKVGRSVVGQFGLVHPQILAGLSAGCEEVFYCELDLSRLVAATKKAVNLELIDLPRIRRDITVPVPVGEFAARVQKLINESAGQLLRGCDLVDDFRKENEEFRRVTFRLTFQASDRTLSHQEVDTEMAAILTRLKEDHQVELCA